MDFSIIPIWQIVPQRPPFLMVDKVLDCNGSEAHTELRVTADNILVDNDKLSSPGIIEHMAQSCAALVGCVNLLHGIPITIGYVGEVRNATISKFPHCGETLHTYVRVIKEVANITLADVKVLTKEELVATAHIKVAKTDIVANLEK